MKAHRYDKDAFLSSNAQDFIEDAIEISSYAIEWHS